MKSIDSEFYEIYSELENVTMKMAKLYKRICDTVMETEANASSVLTGLRSNDGCTASELAAAMGADKEKVRKILYSLQDQKKVVSSGRKICDVTTAEALCWWLK